MEIILYSDGREKSSSTVKEKIELNLPQNRFKVYILP